MKNLATLLLIVTLPFTACLPDPSAESDEANYLDNIPPMNVIVALDLSNRIDTNKNPDQAVKDQMILETILEIFGERQKQFGYMISKDKLTIVCVNQENPAIRGIDFINKLSVDMAKGMNHPKYNRKEEELIKSCSVLYNQAVKRAESGADIYTWFKDDLPTYLKGENYINKVVILTDGYLAFDPPIMAKRPKGTKMDWADLDILRKYPDKWKKLYESNKMELKPHQIDVGKTEVLMMEFNPKNITHELDILKHYWKDWLRKMNVKASEVYPQFTDQNQMSSGLEKFITHE